MSSDESESENVPFAISEAAKNVVLSLLPEISKRKYTAAYNEFKKWCKSKNTKSYVEDVFLVYFSELAQKYAAPSLWSRYSMLKATFKAYDNIDISVYHKLTAYLKRQNEGHKPKKSQVFTPDEVSTFLSNAPDDFYLTTKVALSVGVSGACRRSELADMKVKDVEDHQTFYFIHVPKTKTKVARSFTVVGDFYNITKKYLDMRPQNDKTDRLFINYRNGKFTLQPIGVNTFGKMPQAIAKYLNLPNPELYTGHCFRRTSATLLADAGADIITLKRHGGWNSDKVAEGYVENSIVNKRKIGDKIISNIPSKTTKQDTNFAPAPSTSRTKINSHYQPLQISRTTENPQTSTGIIIPETPSESNSLEEASISSLDVNLSDFNEEFQIENLHQPFNVNSGKKITYQFNNCNVTINNVVKKD